MKRATPDTTSSTADDTKHQRLTVATNGASASASASASGAGAGAGAGAGSGTPAMVKASLAEWNTTSSLAESMIPIIGRLYRDCNVVVHVFGQNLSNASVIDIVTTHQFAVTHFWGGLTVEMTHAVLMAVASLSPPPMKLDLGTTSKMLEATLAKASNADERLAAAKEALAPLIAAVPNSLKTQIATDAKPRDIVLYGFGRIGRLLARVLIEKTGAGSKMLLRAVVVRKSKAGNLKKRASLFALDSVHGKFKGTVEVDEEGNRMVVNGNIIQFIPADDPGAIDYTAYGISDALIVDNTGIWRDRASLSRHLQSKGASKVVLTAPAKDNLPSLVAGINDSIKEDDNIVACASCTTNAIVPTLKLMHETYGIKEAHLETVHSYTNDQNLIDNYHAKARRGRSAALNMVITETGAAKAVIRSLPSLAGKLTGSAVRVPTPDVSLAIIMMQLDKAVTADELKEKLRYEATFGPCHRQIGVSVSEDAVSSDFVGDRRTCIIDLPATIVQGNRVNLYLWYDNEFGYVCQVMRIVQKMSGIVFHSFPSDSQIAGLTASTAPTPSHTHHAVPFFA